MLSASIIDRIDDAKKIPGILVDRRSGEATLRVRFSRNWLPRGEQDVRLVKECEGV
jgi:hypothetical protein